MAKRSAASGGGKGGSGWAGSIGLDGKQSKSTAKNRRSLYRRVKTDKDGFIVADSGSDFDLPLF